MKRLFSVLVFILIFASFLTKGAAAQTQKPNQTNPTSIPINKTTTLPQYPINTNSDVPQNLHTYTQSVVLELISALSCQLAGIDPLNPKGQCLGADPKTGKLGFVKSNGGALGFVTDTIGMTFQIPISSGQYIALLSSHFGIAKPALAATTPAGGYGFNALTPVLGLWTAMRDIVYIFFVLIFVFIGIGVMFRRKIDPRSVMTIQNSLPKIVVGLILVTFSYAISGFLVDMMYVTMYATYDVISGAAPNHEIKYLKPGDVQNQNPFYAAGAIYDVNPFVGLPKLTQDAALGAVGILKDAAGIGDYNGTKLTDEEKARLSTASKDGSGGPPTVSGTFASMFDRFGDIITGIFEQFPSIGIGPLSTKLITDLGGKLIAAPFKIASLFLGGVAVAEQTTYSKLFQNGGGDTMLGRIIRTVSVIGGVYTGIQLGQWDLAAGAHAGAEVAVVVEAGTKGDLGAECSGICSGPIGASIGAIVIAPLIDNMLRTTLPNLIGFFIILGIVITALLKLWFQLIKSYIYILLHVILAPFWIALGLIPGTGEGSVGFGPWLRGLIANLAAFPVTYAMILFAKILTEKVSAPGSFIPPLIGTQKPEMFQAIFGIAILLAIPEMLNLVKTALKAPAGKVGAGVGGAIGAGVGLTKSLASPAARPLIGHKNPMTGKMMWGTLPNLGKRVGGNIAQKVGASIPTPIRQRAGGPLARAVQGARNAFTDPQVKHDQEVEERKAEAAREAEIISTLGRGTEHGAVSDLKSYAANNGVGVKDKDGNDLSIDALAEAVKAKANNSQGIPRDHGLQALSRFQQFRNGLINYAAKNTDIKNPGRMDTQAIIDAIRPTPPAAATGVGGTEAPMGPPEAPREGPEPETGGRTTGGGGTPPPATPPPTV